MLCGCFAPYIALELPCSPKEIRMAAPIRQIKRVMVLSQKLEVETKFIHLDLVDEDENRTSYSISVEAARELQRHLSILLRE